MHPTYHPLLVTRVHLRSRWSLAKLAKLAKSRRAKLGGSRVLARGAVGKRQLTGRFLIVLDPDAYTKDGRSDGSVQLTGINRVPLVWCWAQPQEG